MPEEIAALLEGMEARNDRLVSGLELHEGTLEGKPVLLARCGIGKVNAASVAQLMVVQRPRALIFTGVAGAVDPRLKVGDIVVAEDSLQHDVDVTALGYDLGRVPGEPLAWPSDRGLVTLAVAVAAELTDVNVVTGRVASGDQFVADRNRTLALRERFQPSCVEMEGAAVAQVCFRAALPFVIVRSISDSADHDADVSFREFTRLAADRAKELVRAMVRAMPNV